MKVSTRAIIAAVSLSFSSMASVPAQAGVGHIIRHPFRSTAHGIRHAAHIAAHPFHSTANGIRHVGHTLRHPIKHIRRGVHYMSSY